MTSLLGTATSREGGGAVSWRAAAMAGSGAGGARQVQVRVVPVLRSFCLQSAVCSYGYFMTAPNVWEPAPQGTPSIEPPATPPAKATALESESGSQRPDSAASGPSDSQGQRLPSHSAATAKVETSPQTVTPPLLAVKAAPEAPAPQLLPPPTQDDASENAPGPPEAAVLATRGKPFPSHAGGAPHSQNGQAGGAALPLSNQPGGAVQSGERRWAALATGALTRPLRLADGQVASVRVTEAEERSGAPEAERNGLPTAGPRRALTVEVEASRQLSTEDWTCIEGQVRRMLRLLPGDAHHVSCFQRMHPAAKEVGFGRLFRSPTLFEDMLKSILLCNCGWGRTLSMCRTLCELQAELAKGADGCHLVTETTGEPMKAVGAFPSASELAPLTAELLAKRCGLGYRAQRVLTFAQGVASGRFDLGALEAHRAVVQQATVVAEPDTIQELDSEERAGPGSAEQLGAPPPPVGRGSEAVACAGAWAQSEAGGGAQGAPSLAAEAAEEDKTGDGGIEDLRQKILDLPGFGPYSAANVLQCLGIYSLVPSDSETVRHLKQVRGIRDCSTKNVSKLAQAVYSPFAPYQFLAYWWELKQGYEEVFGPIRSVSSSEYGKFTGSSMTRGVAKSASAPELSKAPPASRKRKTSEGQGEGSATRNGEGSAPNGSGDHPRIHPPKSSTPDISRVPLAARGASRKRKASSEALSDSTVTTTNGSLVTAVVSNDTVADVQGGVADTVTKGVVETAGDERGGRRTRRRIRYS